VGRRAGVSGYDKDSLCSGDPLKAAPRGAHGAPNDKSADVGADANDIDGACRSLWRHRWSIDAVAGNGRKLGQVMGEPNGADVMTEVVVL
jgi:hypothetical protein